MEVKLKLKNPYQWGCIENPCQNDIGFVNTKNPLTIGDEFYFESLNPISKGGDLNENHYHYFMGRKFRVVAIINTRVRQGVEAEEIDRVS